MPIITIAAKVIFTSSACCLSVAIIHKYRERVLQSMFQAIEKIPQYDFDYIQDINDLPQKKIIALCATTGDQHNVQKSKFNNNQEILYSSLLEEQSNKSDRLWKSSQPLTFLLQNEKDWTIVLENQKKSLCFMYNLPILKKSIPHNLVNLSLSLQQKFKLMTTKQLNFKEHVILPNQKYVFIGEMIVRDNDLIMKPRYILGEKREHLLKHIDDTIMNTRKKSRILIAAGLGFLLLHNLCINNIREHNRNVLQQRESNKLNQ